MRLRKVVSLAPCHRRDRNFAALAGKCPGICSICACAGSAGSGVSLRPDDPCVIVLHRGREVGRVQRLPIPGLSEPTREAAIAAFAKSWRKEHSKGQANVTR